MEEDLPTRWEIELEFVQSLSNIQYVNFLAQNDYLSNAAFLNYLDYLSYWKKPQYAKYLVYPNCLHILTLLQSGEFRRNIVNPEFMNTVMNDMVKRWQSADDGIFTGSASSVSPSAAPLHISDAAPSDAAPSDVETQIQQDVATKIETPRTGDIDASGAGADRQNGTGDVPVESDTTAPAAEPLDGGVQPELAAAADAGGPIE